MNVMLGIMAFGVVILGIESMNTGNNLPYSLIPQNNLALVTQLGNDSETGKAFEEMMTDHLFDKKQASFLREIRTYRPLVAKVGENFVAVTRENIIHIPEKYTSTNIYGYSVISDTSYRIPDNNLVGDKDFIRMLQNIHPTEGWIYVKTATMASEMNIPYAWKTMLPRFIGNSILAFDDSNNVLQIRISARIPFVSPGVSRNALTFQSDNSYGLTLAKSDSPWLQKYIFSLYDTLSIPEQIEILKNIRILSGYFGSNSLLDSTGKNMLKEPWILRFESPSSWSFVFDDESETVDQMFALFQEASRFLDPKKRDIVLPDSTRGAEEIAGNSAPVREETLNGYRLLVLDLPKNTQKPTFLHGTSDKMMASSFELAQKIAEKPTPVMLPTASPSLMQIRFGFDDTSPFTQLEGSLELSRNLLMGTFTLH